MIGPSVGTIYLQSLIFLTEVSLDTFVSSGPKENLFIVIDKMPFVKKKRGGALSVQSKVPCLSQ